MKLFKNQSGTAHLLVVFVIVFAVIGTIGVLVSSASTRTGGLLSRGLGIEGRVTLETNTSDRCENQTNSSAANNCNIKPYANASGSVSLIGTQPECSSDNGRLCPQTAAPAISKPFTTDRNGRFKLELQAGTYSVAIDTSRSKSTTCETKTVTIKKARGLGGGYVDVRIKCVAGDSVEPQANGINGSVVITASDTAGSCASTPANSCERPYGGATGYVSRQCDPGQVCPQVVTIDQTFKADDQGKFKLELSPGAYTVVVDNEGTSATRLNCEAQTAQVLANLFTEVKLICTDKV